VAAITPSSQLTEMSGDQLPSLTDCTTALTATSAAAAPATAYSHVVLGLMTTSPSCKASFP
jgi:hypothetical protein